MISTHGRHPASSCPKSHPNNITSLLWCLLCPQRSQYLTSESEVCIIGSSVKCKKKKNFLSLCNFLFIYLFWRWGEEDEEEEKEEGVLVGGGRNIWQPFWGKCVVGWWLCPFTFPEKERENKQRHTHAGTTHLLLAGCHTHTLTET